MDSYSLKSANSIILTIPSITDATAVSTMPIATWTNVGWDAAQSYAVCRISMMRRLYTNCKGVSS